MQRRIRFLASTGALFVALGSPALAQEVGSTAPAIGQLPAEYRARGARFGNFRLDAGGEVRVDYNDNVYALPDDKTDDAVLYVRRYGQAIIDEGKFAGRLYGSVDLRRFAEQTSENSNAAQVLAEAAWRPSANQSLSLEGSWSRAVEERGDPEARRTLGIGPRRYDVVATGVQYRHKGTRILLNAEANMQKVDALAAIDDDRDFTSHFGQVVAGLRVNKALFVTAGGFVNRRDFRLETTPAGIDRDTVTYGGRVGLQFDEGGYIEGRVAAGIFVLNYDDPSFSKHTGFSLAGNLTFRPFQRTAVTLDLFNGDVASFRGGAVARTDTRVGVGLQQEMRHNLFARITADYRQSDYFLSDIREKTYRYGVEVEWLCGAGFSLVASASQGKRKSDLDYEEFDRFRGGLGIRHRF